MWLSARAAALHLQATTCTAALVLLCTPAGDLVNDGKSYSIFCFFDVVITALAIAVVVRSRNPFTRLPRPDRRQLRQLSLTAAGVTGLVLGDAIMVLSQIRTWAFGAGVGLASAVAGVTLLLLTYLHPAPRRAGSAPALPPAPVRTHPRLSVAVAVLMQNVLPLLIAIIATAQVVTAMQGRNGGLNEAASSTGGVGAVTVGTAAAAVLLPLLHASAQARRTHRDAQQADAAERDELTGAYTRRGFTAFALQHLSEDPGEHDLASGTGARHRDGLIPQQGTASSTGSVDVSTGTGGVTEHPPGTSSTARSRPGIETWPSPGTRADAQPDIDAAAGPNAETGASTGWSVALLDLNGFKAVNDTFGHDVGDQVLRTVTQRAAAVIDGHGIVARFGGDEFVALLDTGPVSSPATRQLLQRLKSVITEPITCPDSGVVLSVGVSIGVAAVARPGRSQELSAALKQADERMYTQKNRHHS